jgi:pimeloyl-ACP methyl ester carboxylesterase
MNHVQSELSDDSTAVARRRAASFTTSDGVRLVYRDNGGPGIPLVMLPGLGQGQLAFHEQFDGLADRRRIITLDHRGHGLSAAPDHGYRIARLSADVRDLLDHLDIQRVDALGWSMGASVWWSFIDLFGSSRIRRLVIVDQPVAIAKVPWMTPREQADAGALWDLPTTEQIVAEQLRPDSAPADVESLRWSYTGEIAPEVLELLVSGMRQGSPRQIGRLLFDHSVQDWRDVLPRIDVPTLVIGSEGSHVSVESQRRTAEAIPRAKAHIFPADIASSHFPFLQNPAAFNRVLEGFLA